MSKSKHTPGPWFQEGAVGDWSLVFNEDGEAIARTLEPNIGGSKNTTFEERQANARLIAASPALLEACKGLLAQVDNKVAFQGGEGHFRSAAIVARAAIALCEVKK